MTYSLEQVTGQGRQPAVPRSRRHRRATRSCRTRCCIGEGGAPDDQPDQPSIVHNTIDNPIFPTQGTRSRSSSDFAGHRRQRQLHQAARRGRVDVPADRTAPAFGIRGQVEYIKPYGSTVDPADLREAVPGRRVQRPRLRHPVDRPARPRSPAIVIGGDKSLLFNAEYLITIAGPVRAGAVLRRRPGAGRRASASRGTTSRCRRAPRSGSSCRC